MKLLFCLLFLPACGLLKKNHEETPTVNPLEDLRAKYVKVLEISKQNLDSDAWPKDVMCDGLTFTSIYSLAGGLSDPFKAEDKATPGKYYRDAKHACGPANQSSATTQSQDAFIMLATILWKNKDTARIQSIVDYLNANDHYTGDPHNGISKMSFPVFNTYSIMLAKLKGESAPPAVEDPTPAQSGEALASVVTGFRAHLLMWHIYDRGKIYGALNDLEYKVLRDQADRQPRNALFKAMKNKFTDGDQSIAIANLMDESLYPSDKPCSTSERCVPYLWSTDDTPADWEACPAQNKTFTCIDWLIAAKIILGD